MQALVLRGPWEIEVDDIAEPEPGPGQVLIRIIATGICGSDIHGFTGENGRRHPGQVMGHETVGRVAATGAGVALALGTLVTVNPVISCGSCRACASGAEQSCPDRRVIGVAPEIASAFAEQMLAPATNVVALPDEMPDELGALVEPLAVGYHAARRGGCSERDSVLVIGGGPIGQACALAARRLGARALVVSEPSGIRRSLVEKIGFDVVDPLQDDLAGAVARSLGEPATLVLDAVGSSRSLADAAATSSFGARIVLVGMNEPTVEVAAYAVSTEERTLVGSFCYSAADFETTAAWVGTAPGELQALIDGRVDLAGAPEAFSQLGKALSAASKVLVFPHGVPEEGVEV